MPRKRLPARLYLRQRPGRPGRWVIVDGDKEIDTGCGTGDRDGAEAEFGKYLTRHRAIDTTQRDPAQISCADVIALYIRHFPAPPACYHATPLLAFFGLRTLAELNGQLCRDFASQRGQKVSLATARREMETFQAAINHWHRESPLAAVPQLWKPAKAEARQRYLTRGEAARLLAASRRLKLPHLARFILLGLYTGTRHDALLRLRWHASRDAGWVDVATAVLHRKGEDERQTRKKRTAARIPHRLMAHIRIWQASDLAAGPQAAIIRWKGRPITKERRAWASVVEAANLGWYTAAPDGGREFETDVTPHTLKHTCITWGLQTGIDIWDLAGLTGTSAKTIESNYGHHDPEFQIAVAGAFRRAG